LIAIIAMLVPQITEYLIRPDMTVAATRWLTVGDAAVIPLIVAVVAGFNALVNPAVAATRKLTIDAVIPV
jgi:hypothetical protein